jgi:hydroxymethylglutaryl-CoA synthase
LGLLRYFETLRGGDRISFYGYGSGCQAEFYDGVIPKGAREAAGLEEIDRQIATRKGLSLPEYDGMARARQRGIDRPCFRPLEVSAQNDFDEMYSGRNLLVLEEVRDFRRYYMWS